jgi:hypothetical protein
MKTLREATIESGTTTTLPRADDNLPEIGDWFWVDEDALRIALADNEDFELEDDDEEENEEESLVRVNRPRWLGAVTFVGTNYAEVEGFIGNEYGSSRTRRIHFDIFDSVCTLESDAESIISGNAARHTANARALMAEVMDLTRRLGVTPRAEIGDGSDASGETQALAIRGSNESIAEYKQSLIRAQKEELPDLFKRIEKQNKIAAGWMTAQLIPMKAKAEALQPLIKTIENRIFSVELYAGLIEKVKQISDGEPAPNATPITLMQRRCYMDEESLADYQAGGMDYKKIGDFDVWIAQPKNRDRILPAPRCIVAFRVRRYDKERESESLMAFIRMFDERAEDRKTFLYIRNGERLYRLSTGIDFGDELFPDLDRLDTTQRLYVFNELGSAWNRAESPIVTEGVYLSWIANDEAHEASKRTVILPKQGKEKDEEREASICSCNEYRLAYKKVPSAWSFSCHYRSKAVSYEPYTPDSVFFDDATAHLAEEQARHNRLVLVLQGLLDRSPVFHPHPPWRIWEPSGFAAALNLIYDNGRAITPGDAPDFEAYRARLNASIEVGSLTVGQEEAWERIEAEKENAKDKQGRSVPRYRYRPHHDPGPGTIAKVAEIKKRTKACVYRWTRKKNNGRKVWIPDPRRPGWGHNEKVYDDIQVKVTIPTERVLNVSAYTPGDFHQFFDDPRTRADYIRWAPLLLTSEDHVLGMRKERRTDPMPDGSQRCGGGLRSGHSWTGGAKKGDPCDCGLTEWSGMGSVRFGDADDDDDDAADNDGES